MKTLNRKNFAISSWVHSGVALLFAIWILAWPVFEKSLHRRVILTGKAAVYSKPKISSLRPSTFDLRLSTVQALTTKDTKKELVAPALAGGRKQSALLPGAAAIADAFHLNPHSATLLHHPQDATALSLTTPKPVKQVPGAIPLVFERNDGQTDASVKFLARGPSGSLFFTPSEIVLAASNMRMRFVGSNVSPEISGVEPLPGRSNYLLGNNSGNWKTDIPQYAKVQYKQLYPGIDVVFYGTGQQLEYDLIVAPGVDPGVVQIEFVEDRAGEGERGRVDEWESTDRTASVSERGENASQLHRASAIRIDENGDLVVQTSAGQIRQLKPRIYQELNGVKFPVPGRYALKQAAGYQQSSVISQQSSVIGQQSSVISRQSSVIGQQSSVIGHQSSVISRQTAGGSRQADEIRNPQSEIRNWADRELSTTDNGQRTTNQLQHSPSGQIRNPQSEIRNWAVSFQIDAYDKTKQLVIDPVLATSFELKSSGASPVLAVTSDSAGNWYMVGSTTSADFPVKNPLQANYAAGTCSFQTSTFPCSDAFVVKMNPAMDTILYATYLGGTGEDQATGVGLDSAGNIYIVGETASTDFPTANAFQNARAGGIDFFVAKLNAAGSALLFSTYFGGSQDDRSPRIAVDSSGNAYITGQTSSSNFPTKTPFQAALGGNSDAVVAKLTPSGSLVYSSFLGGSGFDSGNGIAVDAAGNAYITGDTGSANFPTKNPLQAAFRGNADVFITKVDASGTSLVYSTYLGGTNADRGRAIAVDASGSAYITGSTNSTNFPTLGPFQAASGGGTCGSAPFTGPCNDAFVAKLNAAGSALIYSTYLGGNLDDSGEAITIDKSGLAYIAGTTRSTNFPTQDPVQAALGGQSDFFVSVINPAGSALQFSTYLGGPDPEFAAGIALGPSAATKQGGSGAIKDSILLTARVNAVGSIVKFINSHWISWQLFEGQEADLAVKRVDVTAKAISTIKTLVSINVLIQNNGPNTTGGVVEFFKAGWDLDSATIDGGSCDLSESECSLPILGPKESTFTRFSGSTFTAFEGNLSLEVKGNLPDPIPSNNKLRVDFFGSHLGVEGGKSYKQRSFTPLETDPKAFGAVVQLNPLGKTPFAVATTPPVALSIFSLTLNNILITEAGVPAASPVTKARMFVDLAGGSNSGVAIVNPGTTPITINLEARDASGALVSTSSANVPAKGHLARFPTELGLSLPANFLGTVALTSGSPFAAVNLRTATNAHGEPLFSALPLADLNNPPKGSSLILSQIVDGGGIPTQILMMNPSATDPATGNVSLFDDNGNAFAADFGPPVGIQSRISYSIPANGMAKFSTTGIGQPRALYAVVTAQTGPLPVAGAIFSINGSLGLASQAGVLSSPETTSARLYIEVASSPLNRNTGIAIVNRNSSTATITLNLTDNVLGTTRTATLNLGPNAHVAKFITEVFKDLPADFQGTLTLTSNVQVAPVTLRLTTNQRGEPILSTLPVADLNNPPTGNQYLAQIVAGGGFTTELILINTSDNAITVQIDFFDDNGVKVISPFP